MKNGLGKSAYDWPLKIVHGTDIVQRCELKKDIRWATLAARAMQKYDIHFKNNSGVAWKPRMHERPRCLEQPVQLQRTRKRKRGCIDP